MAYTDTWNENTPLGSDPANTADDNFRSLKLDIRERLNSIIGAPIGTALADPVVASTSALSNIPNLTPLVAVQTFKRLVAGAEVVNSTEYSTYNTATRSSGELTLTISGTPGYRLIWPIDIPVGCTITDVSFLAYYTAGTPSNQAKLYKRIWNTNTAPTLVADTGIVAVTSSGTLALQSLGALSEVVAADYRYYVEMTYPVAGTSTIVFVGLAATYTSPTANNRW
jgi:hypothetical protein